MCRVCVTHGFRYVPCVP
ncbi:MAG: CRISPR-associated DxTHG motif protein [Acidobacteria bacterium]|nr:CRISPR-associated DxTHG motif protein [Acidobacteriota bacterium]